MWKLALNHANIIQNNKQWGKCLTMNFFHGTIQGLVGTMYSLLKKMNRQEGCNKNVLVCIF